MPCLEDLPYEILLEIVSQLKPIRATGYSEGLHALIQTSWLFRELTAPIFFHTLSFDFCYPEDIRKLIRLLAVENVTQRAAVAHTKKVILIFPNGNEVYQNYPWGRTVAVQGPQRDLQRAQEIELYRKLLVPVWRSLRACFQIKAHQNDYEFTCYYDPFCWQCEMLCDLSTPKWAADIISDVVENLVNLVDVEIDIPELQLREPARSMCGEL